MEKVKTIVFHYDENAPVKSKKINKKKENKKKNRFDVYTERRVYQLKTALPDEGEAWVKVLRQASEYYYNGD